MIVRSTAGTGAAAPEFALTFDDGPNPPDTDRLLELLAAHDVRAVFCLVGDTVRAHPQVAARIVAAGHLLGNHSLHHDDMGHWSPEQVRADLAQTTAIIEDATGAPVPFFRAPFGSWGHSEQVAAELGMTPLGWQLAVEDWLAPPAELLVERIRDGLAPGGVVLLHDGGGDRSSTVAAVARVLPMLRADGWVHAWPARGQDVVAADALGQRRTAAVVATAATAASSSAVRPSPTAPSQPAVG
jgi:peptidoglycan/xylan/chitin deacetylase (PgdA/CDA1 family)